MAKPITNSGMDISFDGHRVVEAAPIPQERKDQLLQIDSNIALSKAWWAMNDWYEDEADVIGERRAFWGLVYRIVDDPTEDDITWIKIWLLNYLFAGEEVLEFPE